MIQKSATGISALNALIGGGLPWGRVDPVQSGRIAGNLSDPASVLRALRVVP